MSDEDDRVEGAVQLAQDAIQRVAALEKKVERLEETVDRLEEENQQLREQDDFLRPFVQSAAAKPDTRAAVLVQTLLNKAAARDETPGVDPKAKMTNEAARYALGGDASRSIAWQAMQRAVEIVVRKTENEDVLRYVKKPRSAAENSHLLLDLREGELPATIAGYDIVRGGEISGD